MKILIVGAGAVGSVIGGMLAEANHDVSLLGRQSHMAAIVQRGLEIYGVLGKHLVRNMSAYTAAADVPRQGFDIILITTKSYDTEQAVREVLQLISPDSMLISVQNGLGNLEVIANAVGMARTLGATIMFGVVMQAPGSVEVTVHHDRLKLGGLGVMPQEQVESIVQEFTQAGIPSESTPEIMEHIWGKLLYNCCLNPLSALLECNYGELREHQETTDIMSTVIAEIFAVAEGKGVTLMWQEPHEYQRLLIDVLIPNTSAHLSSMLQDIRQGRKTEIDAMNGAIVRLGTELGLNTPTNELLTLLVKAKQRQQRGQAGTSST